MAITALYVYNEPNDFPSVNDNVWVMATSDLNTGLNFRYVVDIFDSVGNLIIRSRVFPDPINGACYFDAASILRNQINSEWFYLIGQDINIVYCRELSPTTGEAAIEFTVYVGEEYYSGIDLVSNLQQTSYTEQAWNYVPNIFGRGLYSSKGFDASIGHIVSKRSRWSPSLGPFMFYDNIKYIKGSAEPLLLGFLSSNDTATMEVKVYNSAGTLINTHTETLSFSLLTLQQLNVSPKAINASAGSTIIDVNAAEYYTLRFNNNSAITNVTVRLECPREGVEAVHLHFMNSSGVFETAIFDLVNKTFLNVNRKGYEKKEVQFGTIDQPFNLKYYSPDINGANKYQFERKVNFEIEANYSMRLAMDFPTDSQFEWLADLMTSPQIFLSNQIGAGNNGSVFYPVTIKGDNYEYFKRKYSKLKTFELEIELNQKRNFYRR